MGRQTGLWALWEKTSRSWGFIVIPRVCRKEEVMGCHPVSFQRFTDEIQFIVQSFVLNFQTFYLRARCSLQKIETWMSAQMICCMTFVLWWWVNGLISCLWIFPTVEGTVHRASGRGKWKKMVKWIFRHSEMLLLCNQYVLQTNA